MLNVIVKPFSEITSAELYAILQLRSEIFVVEQNCVYQDIDYKDQKAMHVLGYKNNNLIAYARVFKPGDYFNHASIGRVVVAKNQRKYGYGYQIMQHAITAVSNYFNEKVIKISAQKYLKKFYESLGFKQVGEAYLEDNIPHIPMIKQ